MRTDKLIIMLLIILLCLFPICHSAHSKTLVILSDFSGSVFKCLPLLTKNLGVVNNQIGTLDKNDHFIWLGYRSLGRPVQIAKITFPNRRGPNGRNISQSRLLLKKQIQKSLANLNELLENSGGDTDIVGALNHTLLYLGDLPNNADPVTLIHFSDGIHTSRTGNFRLEKYQDYIQRLEQQLTREHLVKPTHVSTISWYGAVCMENMNIPLQESAALQSQLRTNWDAFLRRELDTGHITYLLTY